MDWIGIPDIQYLADAFQFKGIAASLHREVSAYTGIPYVDAPVGDLRWRPPQPFPKSNATLAADQFGPDCPALPDTIGNTTNPLPNSILSSLSQPGNVQSEDCLTVNIVSPRLFSNDMSLLIISSGPKRRLARRKRLSW